MMMPKKPMKPRDLDRPHFGWKDDFISGFIQSSQALRPKLSSAAEETSVIKPVDPHDVAESIFAEFERSARTGCEPSFSSLLPASRAKPGEDLTDYAADPIIDTTSTMEPLSPAAKRRYADFEYANNFAWNQFPPARFATRDPFDSDFSASHDDHRNTSSSRFLFLSPPKATANRASKVEAPGQFSSGFNSAAMQAFYAQLNPFSSPTERSRPEQCQDFSSFAGYGHESEPASNERGAEQSSFVKKEPSKKVISYVPASQRKPPVVASPTDDSAAAAVLPTAASRSSLFAAAAAGADFGACSGWPVSEQRSAAQSSAYRFSFDQPSTFLKMPSQHDSFAAMHDLVQAHSQWNQKNVTQQHGPLTTMYDLIQANTQSNQKVAHRPSSKQKREMISYDDDNDDYAPKPAKVKKPVPTFTCSICNITVNSELTLNSHLEGKAHKKKEQLQKVTQLGISLECKLCGLTFEHHVMREQHLQGKKHKKMLTAAIEKASARETEEDE